MLPRMFFALIPNPEFVEGCRRIQGQLAAPDGCRWTTPENLHLTLAFLGPVGFALVDKLRRIRLTAKGPIVETFNSFVAFPNANAATVIGVEATEFSSIIRDLHATLRTELAALGFPPEIRPYRPHVTLARFKHVQPWKTPATDELPMKFLGTQAALFESVSSPAGVRYEVRARYSLD